MQLHNSASVLTRLYGMVELGSLQRLATVSITPASICLNCGWKRSLESLRWDSLLRESQPAESSTAGYARELASWLNKLPFNFFDGTPRDHNIHKRFTQRRHVESGAKTHRTLWSLSVHWRLEKWNRSCRSKRIAPLFQHSCCQCILYVHRNFSYIYSKSFSFEPLPVFYINSYFFVCPWIFRSTAIWIRGVRVYIRMRK